MRFTNLFKYSQDLREMVETIMDRPVKGDDDKSVLTAFFLGKAYKTHGAILLLCNSGYGQDAEVLARTIFDMLITLLYILKDETDGRIKRYLNYASFERKQSFDYIKSKPSLLDELKSKYKTIEEFNESLLEIEKRGVEAKQLYGYKTSWSDKNIINMATEINRLDQYRTAYKEASRYTHTTPRTMNTYMKRETHGHTVLVGQNSDGIKQALVLSFDCFAGIVGAYIDMLKPEYVDKLKVIGNNFVKEVEVLNKQ